ncbi:MAG TPA: hypothetical protein VF469_13490, partial [Kofleriaceae bacterium]
MRRLGCIVFLMGCGFRSPAGSAGNVPIDGNTPPGDDAPVAGTDGPAAQPVCYGKGLVKNVCFSKAPTGTAVLPNTVDTGKDGSCTLIAKQTGGPDLCVIAAGTVEVSSTTVAIGTRPLVLIGADTVRISGTLDASSRRSPGGRTGAGANTGTCAAA